MIRHLSPRTIYGCGNSMKLFGYGSSHEFSIAFTKISFLLYLMTLLISSVLSSKFIFLVSLVFQPKCVALIFSCKERCDLTAITCLDHNIIPSLKLCPLKLVFFMGNDFHCLCYGKRILAMFMYEGQHSLRKFERQISVFFKINCVFLASL